MPYIGRELERGTYLKLDDISSSFDGNKTIFNLTKGGDPFFPGSPQSIIVSVNGTILEPVTEYGIDSSKIVFATAPANGHAFFSITLGLPFGVFDNGSIEDGSLTGFKLSNPFNYDGGLLFLNSLTDKVGIRTENPTHDLDVHGDVRIVGILTVGTSSLILDGSNNKIQVGTALTLSHNDGAQIGSSHLHSTGYDLKDNARIRLGNDNTFQIYHTATDDHNRIESGGKQLRIISSNQIQFNTGAEHMLIATANGSVDLYHGMDGASAQKKFNTSTTGATVTGKLVVTGDLDVQGTTTTLDTLLTEVDKLEVGADNTTVGVAITQSGTGDALTIDDGNTRVFTVKDGGKVGIGTDNPDELLELSGTDPVLKLHDNTGGATHGFKLNHDGLNATIHLQSAGLLTIKQANGNTAANGIAFNTSNNDKERLRITGTGRVGIGTTVPKTKLHAYNGTPSDTGGILVSNVSYSANQDKPYLIIGTRSWSGETTNWNTFGFQHKIKVDGDGIPRLTIDGVNGGSEVEHFTLKDNVGVGIGVTNPQGRLHIPNGGHIRLGNDSDARLFHSGSHFQLQNHTGNTYLRINGTEEGIVIKPNDQVQLFYDNNLRFNTSSDGIKVTGPTSGPGVGIGTTAGHDPLILASFNNAVTNNSQLRIVSKRDTDGTDWNTTYTRIQQRIDVTDQAYIQFNGSDNNYGMEFGTHGDEKFAKFIRNGAVELYHDNGQRFNTTPQGINVTTVGDVPQVAIAQTTTTAHSVNGTVSFVNANNTTSQIQGRTGSATTTGDIIFLCNTVGDETLAILEDGKVRVPDRGSFVVGQGNDLTLKHDTNSSITNITGQLAIETTSGNLSIKASNSNGDIIMRAGGGTSSENAIVAVHHGEVVLSCNGSTRLTTTNTGVDITDNLSVAGITTFSGDINVDSGKTLVLTSNTSDPVIKIQGGGPNFIRFASDASGTVDSDSIDLVYRTTPNQLVFERASDAVDLLSVDADNGLVAITNNLNVTGNLDVDGATTLDGLTVSEAATFSADVNVGDGSAQSRILIKKADNDVADHIQFYNGTTIMGEIGCEDTDFLRINQETNKPIYTPRYIRADAGFFVDGTTKGINGSGNFTGGTIAGASDYDTLLRSDTNDIMNGELTVGGSSVNANEGGQINLTLAPNSSLNGSLVIDQYIDQLRFFEGSGSSARGATIIFTHLSGNTDNEIFSSGLTGVGYTVTHLRSFNLPNGVVAISTSNASHIPLTVTNSGGAGNNTIITKFVGNSDGLEVRNINSGDYHIRVNSLNTGISFYNGGNGMQFLYDNSRKFSAISSGLSLNDELTFENDDEGVTTYDGGRFYKKSGGGIAIRQTSGNQTPIIENNAGTLQGSIIHTGNIGSNTAGSANQIVLGNDSTGSTPRRLVFASADTGTVTIQADTVSGATYTPSNGRIGCQQIETPEIIGNTTIDGNLTFATGHVAQHHATGTRDKYRVWNSSNYAIGMDDAMTYGALDGYAMTFQVHNSSTQGWVFLDTGHSDAQGAMALTSNGKLTVAGSMRLGFGQSDTTDPGTNYPLDVSGQIGATSHIEAGRGSGSVALTLNDGYGNANLCFNHKNGTPDNTDTSASSGRIECSVDSATANMYFELWDSVTEGTATGNANAQGGGGTNGVQMHLSTTEAKINPFLILNNDMRLNASDPEIEFNTGGPRLRCPAANTLSFHTGSGLNSSDEERLRITSDGSALFGGLTSQNNVDTSKLAVQGGDSNIGIILVHAGGGESDGDLSGIAFSHGNDNATSRAKCAIASRAIGSYGKGDLCFYVDGANDNNQVSAADERMRIDSSGIITMYNDLVVEAPSTSNVTRLHGGSIELNRSANDAFIDFKTSTSEDFDCRIQKSGNQLHLITGGNNSTQLTLNCKGSGDVDIPNGKLYVAEEVFFRSEFNLMGATTEATKHMDIGFEGHGFSMRRTTYDDQNHDIFLSVNANGAVTLQSNIGSTSDAKLKKNITTISDGAIENIKKLRPVKFDWIADDKMNDNNGFIAQELKEVFPNLVYGTEYDPTLIDEEKGTKGGIKSEGYSIDLVGISANVTKALQEAIAKIETLEAEVAALKAKVG